MGCCGQARWKREEVPDHKFDFIDVRDYWSNGYITRMKYAFLFANLAKSFAVYVADMYTAITLLAFHHFNGTIYNRVANSPTNTVKVPFDYGKWIFTGCIIFSFLLLAYEAHKARAVIRSRDISYAYTNVMANDYYSIRSYNHFCFFNQINNSKKKKDEVAFFIFFTFKGWKRLLVADGPRQVINALTLYALAEASGFSTNLQDYYEGNVFTLIMLLTMLFTVLVFAGSAILLIVAALLYLPLICYIQGNLKEYCCHKIDKRISELVQKKKKQRLGKYAAIARAEAAGDFSHLMNKKGEMIRRKMVQPTLPNLDINILDDDMAIKKKLDRSASYSSSTMTGGMYGGEKNLYNMNEGDDYASTAQLVMNQGSAGYTFGNSSTMEGAPSMPPTIHNSPDSYPMQIRGMQGVQDVMRTRGMSSNNSILAETGVIGTSPDLMAKRMLGRNNNVSIGGSQQGDTREAYEEMISGDAHIRGPERAKSPLSAQDQNSNNYISFHGMQLQHHQSSDQFSQGQYGDLYGNHEMNHRSADQMTGIDHESSHNPSQQQGSLATGAVPLDLSAYAPYRQDDYLHPNQGGEQHHDTNRPNSFSDVYEAYYNDHDVSPATGDQHSAPYPPNEIRYSHQQNGNNQDPTHDQYYQQNTGHNGQNWQDLYDHQTGPASRSYFNGYVADHTAHAGEHLPPQEAEGRRLTEHSYIQNSLENHQSRGQQRQEYIQHQNDNMYNYQAR